MCPNCQPPETGLEWEKKLPEYLRIPILIDFIKSLLAQKTESEKRSKYWNTMVDILDGQFPKHQCKERGKALIMMAYLNMMLLGWKFNEKGEPIQKLDESESRLINR